MLRIDDELIFDVFKLIEFHEFILLRNDDEFNLNEFVFLDDVELLLLQLIKFHELVRVFRRRRYRCSINIKKK